MFGEKQKLFWGIVLPLVEMYLAFYSIRERQTHFQTYIDTQTRQTRIDR